MSKAFVSDAADSQPQWTDEVDTLPAGAKNYITPAGAVKLKNELHSVEASLAETRRAFNRVKGRGTSPQKADIQRELHRLESRACILRRHVQTMAEVKSGDVDVSRVYFGALVELLENGVGRQYRIVGVDEVDAESGCISWCSPLARALQGGRVGDKRLADLPGGLLKLQITGISYDE